MKRLAALALALLCPALSWGGYNSYIQFASGTAPSYEGLWWNAAESGWGVSIAHQGDTLFAVWYTYDRDGSPMWLVMPDARLTNDDMEGAMGMMDMEMMGSMRNPPIFTGALYRSSKSGNRVVMTEVGNATLLFKDKDNAAFAYTVGNVSQSKSIARMAFGSGGQECTLGGPKAATENFQDLWWNASDPGWGMNIAHQGEVLFATYYTYDTNGKGVWYSMSNTVRAGSAYTGPIQLVRGPAFDAPWDSSRVAATATGTASFTFEAGGAAVFNYSLGAERAIKTMARMAFSLPATVCR
ncbi:MAG TPA: hypothetical protein VM051_05900 [Usitatibacter sp.]|nr:hypothetical protein [Usitatibacter sp.]